MYQHSDVLITTMSQVPGHVVRFSRGLVSVRLITTMHFSYADFFSGNFGSSCEEELQNLECEAYERLRQEATETGANAVLGVHLDYCWIGSSDRSKLMVTAIGTAVYVSPKEDQESVYEPIITERQLEREIDKHRIIEQIRSSKRPSWDARLWRFIIENRITEVADVLANRYSQATHNAEQFVRYFKAVDRNIAMRALYEPSPKVGLIRKCGLIDYRRILDMLDSGVETRQRNALQILLADKPNYTQNDMRNMERIIEVLDRLQQNRKLQVMSKRTSERLKAKAQTLAELFRKTISD